MSTNTFKYNWITKSDIDAFFGLLFDGFSKVLAAIGIMLYGFNMPPDIVIGRILPGLALATFFGNMWYAYEAYKLAHDEERQNVTAEPYGVGSGTVFGWLFLIIGPVYFDTNDPVLAWQVGLAAGFIGGLIEIIGAFVGKKIVKFTPKAALLGNLAAGAIIWLSLVGILNIYDKPFIGVLPLVIVIVGFMGKEDMPFNLPTGLVAIIAGTIFAWSMGKMNPAEVTESINQLKLTLPTLAIKDVFIGIKHIVRYLPVIIPLQIINFLTTLQGIESASVAGDEYPVKTSMTMDGVGTMIGSIFGNPFPTTVYYGHPSWKKIGARAGYSVINGFTYLFIGLTGAAGLISAIIPYQAVMPILVFVGVATGAQAFNETPNKYNTAILLGFFPLIAQYIKQGVDAALKAAETNLDQVGMAAFSSDFPISGVVSLSDGAFLSSLLLAATVAYVIENNYKMAAVFSGITTVSAYIGLIHAPVMSWGAPESFPFAVTYLGFTIICVVLAGRDRLKSGGQTVDEITFRNS